MTESAPVTAAGTPAPAPVAPAGPAGRPVPLRARRLARITRSPSVVLAIEIPLVVALWQLLVDVFHVINPLFLPPPSAIARAFAVLVQDGGLWPNIWASFVAFMIGTGLAVVTGVIAGLLVGTVVAVDKLAGPIIWTIYAVPWLAYRPLSVVWFGFGLGPVIFLAFIAAVFPILINTAAGARTTSPSLLHAARVFGAGTAGTFWKVVMPSTVPFILVGVRQAAVLSTLGVLVAEMTGSSTGVGAMIALSTNTLDTDKAYAAICMAIVWTFVTGEFVNLVGRRLSRWNAGVAAR